MVFKQETQEQAPNCSRVKPSRGQRCCGAPLLPRSSRQQAQQHPILFCSHCSIPVPPQHVNTAWGTLVRKLTACFHHKWLLRFRYCVCLYLATRDPTKDNTKTPERGRVEGRAFVSGADNRYRCPEQSLTHSTHFSCREQPKTNQRVAMPCAKGIGAVCPMQTLQMMLRAEDFIPSWLALPLAPWQCKVADGQLPTLDQVL